MDDRIHTALSQSGDSAGAQTWQRVCRALDEGLQVAIVARDQATAGRLARRLEGAWPGARFTPVGFLPEIGDAARTVPDDRLLPAHAMIWATALPAALGAEERHALDVLIASQAPDRRAVVLVEQHLLARISDDPAQELAEIRERVEKLVSPQWRLTGEDQLDEFVASADASLPELRRRRRSQVARLLVQDALLTREASLAHERSALADVEALLAAEDDALSAAIAEGERIGAHVVAAMRRHAEGLLVDLKTFLAGLEADLPAQIAGVEDTDLLVRTLPHWLHHVVAGALTDGLATFRGRVLADLNELGLDTMEATRAELLVPALYPPPLRANGDLRGKLGATAAIGGGAAMLFFGLWIPGAIALSAGVVWSALSRGEDASKTRDKLTDGARQAVRRMADDAARLISDQLSQIERDLGALGPNRAERQRVARADARDRLLERRAFHRARAMADEQLAADLARTLVGIEPSA